MWHLLASTRPGSALFRRRLRCSALPLLGSLESLDGSHPLFGDLLRDSQEGGSSCLRAWCGFPERHVSHDKQHQWRLAWGGETRKAHEPPRRRRNTSGMEHGEVQQEAFRDGCYWELLPASRRGHHPLRAGGIKINVKIIERSDK